MAEQPSQSGSVGGDMIGGDKIVAGDITGSVAAIGAGAQVIYNNIERALTAVEIEEQERELEEGRLAEGLTNLVSRLQQQANAAKDEELTGTPYKSLLSYDLKDAAVFYGRSSAIGTVMERIERNNLTVLHAESGAGKTSLLKAGIMPRLLANGDLPLYVRPYTTTIPYPIKRAIIPGLEHSPNLAILSLVDFLRATQRLLGRQRLVIMMDQFEEVFTLQSDDQRNEFVNELAPCLNDPTLEVRWMFSMRKEWFGDLGTFRPQIANPFANEFLLRQLNEREAREIITEPARRYGVTYEPGLVNALVEDLGQDEIAPPQLQLVCSALYDGRQGRSRVTFSLYESLGRTEGILQSHLNRVLRRNVPDEQRNAARQLLEALISSDGRRIRRSQIELERELALLRIEREIMLNVIDILIESRLLSVEQIEEENAVVIWYELAHDYLMQNIETDPPSQARKAAREVLERQMVTYRQYGALLDPDEMAIVEAHIDEIPIDEETQTLIESSRARLRRQRGTLVAGVGVIVIMIGVAVVLGLASVNLQQDIADSSTQIALASTTEADAEQAAIDAQEQAAAASEAARLAEEDRQVAQARAAEADEFLREVQALQLAIQASNLIEQGGDAIEATELALQAYKTFPLIEAEAALFAALSQPALLYELQDVSDVSLSEWSPDGETFATYSLLEGLTVWDAATGEIRWQRVDVDIPQSLTWTENGGVLVTFSLLSSDIVRWDAGMGVELTRHPIRDTDRLVAVDISPAGDIGAFVYGNFTAGGNVIQSAETVELINLSRGTLQLEFEVGPLLFPSVELTPDSSELVTMGQAINGYYVYNTATGLLDRQIETPGLEGGELIMSPTGELVAISRENEEGAGSSFAVYALEDDRSLWNLSSNAGTPLSNPSWANDGLWLVTPSRSSEIQIWDASQGVPLQDVDGFIEEIGGLKLSPDESTALINYTNGTTALWNLNGANLINSLVVGPGALTFAEVASTGERILIVTRDDGATRPEIYNINTAEQVGALEGHEGEVRMARWSPDATRIASIASDQTIRIWDAETAEQVGVLNLDAQGTAVAWSSDSNRLLTLTDAGGVIWDVESGSQLLILPFDEHIAAVTTIKWSSDGQQILTGSNDGTAFVWDATSGEVLIGPLDHG
ncbi:MAG: WD40 repeat domain-containing protein, partial [Chloroflexi bacterium]|nr:WD40 repeat domain-containing protein [Chloroflexota bacterium]